MSKDLQILQSNINYQFKDINLLRHALMHRSYLNEHKDESFTSNEKLEFLGDSVLSLVTTKYLFDHYPTYQEGDYTDIKATIVRTESLALSARSIDLGAYLSISRGEEENGGRNNTSILADSFEALIAAIYLDSSFESANTFIINYLFTTRLDQIITSKSYLSAKNLLQELYQEKYKKLPRYEVIDETGPHHDRSYKVGVFDDDKLLSTGIGKSKKTAEEEAARACYNLLTSVAVSSQPNLSAIQPNTEISS